LRFIAEQAKQEGAEALLITEKDLVNLPEGAPAHTFGMPIFWLRTRLEVDREDAFMAWILESLGSQR
jgi:tetraacyldisaccharide-1-P 4'-kinase